MSARLFAALGLSGPGATAMAVPLRAQAPALAGAQRLSPFLAAQSIDERWVEPRRRDHADVGQLRVFGPVFVRELMERLALAQPGSGMEPLLGDDRRLMQGLIDDVAGVTSTEVFEGLAVGLLDHPEAAEFSLRMIEVAVVETCWSSWD